MRNKFLIIKILRNLILSVVVLSVIFMPITAFALNSNDIAFQETKTEFTEVNISVFSLFVIGVGSLIVFIIIIWSIISQTRKKKKIKMTNDYRRYD